MRMSTALARQPRARVLAIGDRRRRSFFLMMAQKF